MRVTKYKTKLTESKKVELTKEISINYAGLENKFTSPDDVYLFARNFLRMHLDSEEYMYMFCFNTKMVMTSVFEISHGNVNSSIVGPREVFQKALLANAVGIILAHNHPSGDPTPSAEDIKVTKRLIESGEILGINVLDHLVIGDGKYVSLKEKGYL